MLLGISVEAIAIRKPMGEAFERHGGSKGGFYKGVLARSGNREEEARARSLWEQGKLRRSRSVPNRPSWRRV